MRTDASLSPRYSTITELSGSTLVFIEERVRNLGINLRSYPGPAESPEHDHPKPHCNHPRSQEVCGVQVKESVALSCPDSDTLNAPSPPVQRYTSVLPTSNRASSRPRPTPRFLLCAPFPVQCLPACSSTTMDPQIVKPFRSGHISLAGWDEMPVKFSDEWRGAVREQKKLQQQRQQQQQQRKRQPNQPQRNNRPQWIIW